MFVPVLYIPCTNGLALLHGRKSRSCGQASAFVGMASDSESETDAGVPAVKVAAAPAKVSLLESIVP